MGNEAYLEWDPQNEDEKKMAHDGRPLPVRAPYHCIYTFIDSLLPEAWEQESEGYASVAIPNKTLVERLPEAIETANENIKKQALEQLDANVHWLKKFLALHKQKEEAGLNPRIFFDF